jgi:hypothetical protein
VFSLYLFSAIVGGALIGFSVFGHGDAHGHDFGGGHATGHDFGHDNNPFKFLSLRTLTYFLFVFGGVGAVLSKTWVDATLMTFIVSTALGLGVGSLVSAAFGYLRKTDSGGRDADDSFIGLTGQVTLPFSAGGLGKVLLRRGDRTFELIAQPHHESQAHKNWKAVVVVDMKRGTAIVSPVDDSTLQS